MPGHRKLARQVLAWITYAQRLLTTEELRHALAIELDERALDDQNLNDTEEIVSVCAGLVTIDQESSIIRLTHYTTQEYFERVRLEWNPSAQEEIAAACLTYLLFDVFQSGSCASDKAFEQRLAENPLFDYSTRYWSRHMQPVQCSYRASELALEFLCNDVLVDSVSQAAPVRTYRYQGYSLAFGGQKNGLHLVAESGLADIAGMLLERKSRSNDLDIDSKDSYGQTPLSRAAEGGHELVVQLLLATGQVDIDSKNRDGQTPLSYAAKRGHELAVQLLLATGQVDIDSKGNDDWTLVLRAA